MRDDDQDFRFINKLVGFVSGKREAVVLALWPQVLHMSPTCQPTATFNWDLAPSCTCVIQQYYKLEPSRLGTPEKMAVKRYRTGYLLDNASIAKDSEVPVKLHSGTW